MQLNHLPCVESLRPVYSIARMPSGRERECTCDTNGAVWTDHLKNGTETPVWAEVALNKRISVAVVLFGELVAIYHKHSHVCVRACARARACVHGQNTCRSARVAVSICFGASSPET